MSNNFYKQVVTIDSKRQPLQPLSNTPRMESCGVGWHECTLSYFFLKNKAKESKLKSLTTMDHSCENCGLGPPSTTVVNNFCLQARCICEFNLLICPSNNKKGALLGLPPPKLPSCTYAPRPCQIQLHSSTLQNKVRTN